MARSETNLRSMIANSSDPKSLPWYESDLKEVPEPAKTLLAEYSKIPSDQVVQHVNSMRDRAFAVFPYPCIGSFRFLDLSIPQSTVYPEILQRLKSGEKLLDVGCAIGQELRHLVFDGVPPENLYSSDIRQDFYDIGYDLFADRSTLKSQFFQADIFDDNSSLVQNLTGKVNIVNAASFFHLFSWDQQIVVAKRVISLLAAQPGSLVIGRQVGNADPADPGDKANAPTIYRHNPTTWKQLWEQVGQETGSKWEVECSMEKWEGLDRSFGKNRDVERWKMKFVVRRV
ncbi:uncharacterized protein N7498_006507 [Penicillium cinerascens]|uniref:Methyltransferase domain-containing protein n=1 Tax=Penicillium cinerascens TaxID=70096 RepID=A0A9W9SXE2_9EURO|nr:uncharacterized protein N7498_006507 [Penicillium cinerascens]KAJ5201844.1 hypothetical protein N7498_006507 [Penicillium cinerascens]